MCWGAIPNFTRKEIIRTTLNSAKNAPKTGSTAHNVHGAVKALCTPQKALINPFYYRSVACFLNL